MSRIRFNAFGGGLLLAASLSVHAHHTPEHAAALGDPGAMAAAADLSVTQCWVRVMPAQVPSAAYFSVQNTGNVATRLVGVETDAYGSVMMHATTHTGGMSRMSMAHDVAIGARSRLAFEPGGYHVMLSKPARTIEVGKTLELTLVFAGNVRVQVPCSLREASALGH